MDGILAQKPAFVAALVKSFNLSTLNFQFLNVNIISQLAFTINITIL